MSKRYWKDALPVRLREMRERRGLTQREVAEAAGLDATYVSQVECGHRAPSLGNLVRLADALRARIDWLMWRDDVLRESAGVAR